jgi:hypothetical protein
MFLDVECSISEVLFFLPFNLEVFKIMIPSTSFQVPRSSMTARSGNNTNQLEVLRALLTDLEQANTLWIDEQINGCRQNVLPLFEEVEPLEKKCKEQKLLCGDLPEDLEALYSGWVG